MSPGIIFSQGNAQRPVGLFRDPMASSTWGPGEPEVQAEPVEAAIPFISRLSNSDSPSMCLKMKLAWFGRRHRMPGQPDTIYGGKL